MLDLFALCIVVFVGLNFLKLLVETVAIFKSIKIYRRRLRNKKNIITYNGHEDIETWPRVSIIKPICMDTVKVKRIIESFFQIDYPSYEIHFCFQTKTNSCIQFIQQISQKYPKIKTYIHTDAIRSGYLNNKVINIAQGFERAKGEFVWTVDENVRCYVSVLKEMITQFDNKDVACVHQIPLVHQSRAFDNSIAMTYFATHHTRYIYFCDAVGIVCLAGMSMVYDKEKLDEIGGIKAFSRFLSEDYFLANAFVNRGYEIRLSNTPAIQEGEDITLTAFCSRMIRWTKLRFSIHFFTTLGEPLVHPLFYSLVSALTLSYIIHVPFVFIFIIYLFGNFALDQLFVSLTRMMFPEGGEVQNLVVRVQAYFFLQFFLVPYIFAKSLRRMKHIVWKDREYEISQKTIIYTEESENKKSVVLNKRYQRFREIQTIEQDMDNAMYNFIKIVSDCTIPNIFQPESYVIIQSEPHVIFQPEPHSVAQVEPHFFAKLEPSTIVEFERHAIVQLEPDVIVQLEKHFTVQQEPSTIVELGPYHIVQSNLPDICSFANHNT